MIETYIRDEAERANMFDAYESDPYVRAKAQWALKWIERDDIDLAHRLAAFAAVEGIFFSGSFCAIYWLKKRNLMPGLCQSNEYIARDEGLHTRFACYMFQRYTLRPARVIETILEAVAIEKSFVTGALPVELLGMNSTLMCQVRRA